MKLTAYIVDRMSNQDRYLVFKSLKHERSAEQNWDLMVKSLFRSKR